MVPMAETVYSPPCNFVDAFCWEILIKPFHFVSILLLRAISILSLKLL